MILDENDLEHFDDQVQTLKDKIYDTYTWENNGQNVLSSAATDAETYQKQEARIQAAQDEVDAYEDLRNRPDFSDKSNVNSEYGQLGNRLYNGADDIRYDVINNLGSARAAATSGTLSASAEEYLPLLEMTPQEVQIYNYLYDPNNKAASDAYLEKLTPILNKRHADTLSENLSDYASQNAGTAALASVGSALLTLEKGRGIGYALTQSMKGEEADPYSPYFDATRAQSTIRGTTGEMIQENVGGFGGEALSFLYDTGMSFVDSVGSAAAFGPGGLSLIGLSAASDTSYDVLQRGGSTTQALVSGGLAGAAEGVFEKIGLDNLFGAATPGVRRSLIKTGLKQAGIEGTEEALTEVANFISDTLVMGDLSNYQTEVRQYISQGMTQEEAKQKATQTFAQNVGLAALGGGLMGGVSGTVAGAVGNYRTDGENRGFTTSQSGDMIGTEGLGGALPRERIVGDVTYRYTETAPEAYSPRSQEIKAGFDELGIESIVTDGAAESERNGRTVTQRGQASTLKDGSVLLRNDADDNLYSGEFVGHEMYHVGKTRHAAESQAFYDSVAESGNIDFQSEAFRDILDRIDEMYFGGNLDFATDYAKFYEEFTGYVSGDLKENNGTLSAYYSSMFYDPTAVSEAWTTMHTLFLEDGKRGTQNGRQENIRGTERARAEVNRRLLWGNGSETAFGGEEAQESGITRPISRGTGAQAQYYGEIANSAVATGQEIANAGEQGNNAYLGFNGAEGQNRAGLHALQTEPESEVSTDATLRNTGEHVTVSGIASAEKGTVRLSSGESVPVQDVTFSTDDDGLLYQQAVSFPTEAAGNALLRGYSYAKSEGIGTGDYIQAFRAYYTSGLNGEDFSYYGVSYAKNIQNADAYTAWANGTNRRAALGKEKKGLAAAKDKASKKAIDRKARPKTGGVIKEYTKKSLTKRQEASVRALDSLGKALGISFIVRDSANVTLENGETVDANGFYNPKDRTIVVGLDVPDGALLRTAGHELTHYIEDVSKEKYGVLCKFVEREINHTGGEGAFDRLVKEKQKLYREETGEAFSREDAVSEVVADSCEMFLSNEAMFAKLAQQDNTLARQLKKALDAFLQKIREAFAGIRESSIESMLLRESERLEDIQAAWGEMLLDAAGKQNGRQAINSVKFHIDPNFNSRIEHWDKEETGFMFRVGNTSAALQSIGIESKPIFWDASKIKRILKEHKQMTIEIIKQVPHILEEPILIMESRTHKQRLTMFGTVYDTDGSPVLAVLELNPSGNDGRVLNIIKIASAYGKDTNPQLLIDRSNILYVDQDKKRTDNWLTVNRLQLPLPSTNYGSETNIPQNGDAVNISISENGENDTGRKKFSIRHTTDNKPVVIVEENILDGVPRNEWVHTAKEAISKFSGGIPVSGRLIKVNRITKQEYTYSENTKRYNRENPTRYKDKLNAANNLDEIVLASTNYVNEDLKHERKDNFKEFARGDVLLQIGGRDYSAKVIVGFTTEKQMVLYDVIGFKTTDFTIKKVDVFRNIAQSERKSDSVNTSTTDNISQNANAVNISISKTTEKDSQKLKKQLRKTTAKSDYALLQDADKTIAKTEAQKQAVRLYNEIADKIGPMQKELSQIARDLKTEEDKQKIRVLNQKQKNRERDLAILQEKLDRRAKNPDLRDVLETAAEQELDALIETYGRIRPGEKRTREISVPKNTSETRRVRQTVRTILESGAITDEMVPEIKRSVLQEKFSYTPVSNKESMSWAKDYLEESGYEGALERWRTFANSEHTIMGKKDIALGEYLLQEAADMGDTAEVLRISAELSEVGTRAGQAVQALSMLKRLDRPEIQHLGELYYLQKAVDQLNRDIERRFSSRKKPPEKIKLDEQLAQQYLTAETEEDRELVKGRILKQVADQVPATRMEKWNAWRYTAMLLNPRTVIRNVVGNMVFIPAISLKNTLAVPMERIANRISRARGNDGIEMSKTLYVRKEYRQFAKQDFEEVKNIIKSGGKSGYVSEVMEQRKIYKTQWLEWLREKSGWLLDNDIFGDGAFLRAHYTIALSQYLQANRADVSGMTAAELDRARMYAIQQAQKNTYRDASAAAQVLAKLGRTKGGGLFVEGLLPFKNTPVNILKRGIEYSPAGLLKALAKGSYDLKRGRISASEYIDGIAAGFSGTAILALGALAVSLGFLQGGYDDDDEEQFAKLQGEQEYSIRLFGHSYTIDWMAPVSMPFFVGAEIMAAFRKEGSWTFAEISDALTTITEPMLGLSMLSGLNSTIDAISYEENKLTALGVEALSSYLQQAFPSVLGALARTADDTRRLTYYYDKNKDVSKAVQFFIQKLIGKVPFLSDKWLEPRVDEWGEEQRDPDVLTRAFENFISPGYIEKIDPNDVEKEIGTLYESTKNKAVLPDRPQKYITIDGEKKHLTAAEYTALSKISGQLSYEILSDMIQLPEYDELNDEDRAAMVEDAYTYAAVSAKMEVAPEYSPGGNQKWILKAQEAEANGMPVELYILTKNALSGIEGEKDKDGNTIDGSKKKAVLEEIDRLPLTAEQKDALYFERGYSESTLDEAPWH